MRFDRDRLGIPPRALRAARVCLAVAFGTICLYPYSGRLLHPFLFSDDIVRIEHLQTMPLGRMLVRPFNEHLAPLFELVSWTTWQAAGQQLANAPRAFTTMAQVPFVLSLIALGWFLSRDLGSMPTALVAVAVFSLSGLHTEAVIWYSASSFMWALLGTLLAFGCAGLGARAERPGPRAVWWSASAIAALAAPAFSAIGLLAGPLGAVRIGAAKSRRPSSPTRRFQACAGAVVPLLGTCAYLGLASIFRFREVLTDSVRIKLNLETGVLTACRAPIVALLPGLVGIRDADRWIPAGLDLVLCGVVFTAALVWAWRSPQRPWILGGLLLIVGGYGLTYCMRASEGPYWMLRVQRYHLFPQMGLALLAAAALKPVLSRLSTLPVLGLGVVSALAGLLLAIHLPEMRLHDFYYTFPEQPRTIAALDRLADICRREGITRSQALAALDPIRTRWFPTSLRMNALALLPPIVDIPRIPDNLVRPMLLAALSEEDREGLCGGMDASRYLRPASEPSASEVLAIGRQVESVRIQPTAESGTCLSEGWPAYVEYRMPSAVEPARTLLVPGSGPGEERELWWTGPDGSWSPNRSVRWRPDSQGAPDHWAIPLDRLPHWRQNHAQRLRIFYYDKGLVRADSPRLVR